MKAIVVTDQAMGTVGIKLVERPEPTGECPSYGDVVVKDQYLVISKGTVRPLSFSLGRSVVTHERRRRALASAITARLARSKRVLVAVTESCN